MREPSIHPGEVLLTDFSSNTYAYKYRLSFTGERSFLRVHRTDLHIGQAALICDLSLTRPEAEALGAALDIYLMCGGLRNRYELHPSRGEYPLIHSNGNVTLGKFVTLPSGRVYTCKSLATYRADLVDSFGLVVDEPQGHECVGLGDRVADLALDLADATMLRDGLAQFVASAQLSSLPS